MNELTHWKKLTNPDYLGAYALQPGADLIVTIKGHGQAEVTGMGGKKAEKTVIFFHEDVKPMVLNKTNAKTIEKIYKTPYMEQWKDKKIQIHIEHNIQAFGEVVDGIRVRPFLPKEESPKCDECGNDIVVFNGRSPQTLANYTMQKYGKKLCHVCAGKEAGNGGK